MDEGEDLVAPEPFQDHAGRFVIDPEEIGDLGIGGFAQDMKLEIPDLDAEHLHFLGETEPVLHPAVDSLPRHAGADPFLAYEQAFEDQLIDGLSQGVARNLQVAGQLHLAGQELSVFVFVLCDQFPEELFSLFVQGDGRGVVYVHDVFSEPVTNL